MRSRVDLFPTQPKIEAFLTDLAVHDKGAPSTQNQATDIFERMRQRLIEQQREQSATEPKPEK
jgi:hypothetical protein